MYVNADANVPGLEQTFGNRKEVGARGNLMMLIGVRLVLNARLGEAATHSSYLK